MKRLLAGLMVILMLGQCLPEISFAASMEELPAKETPADASPAEEHTTETASAEKWHELVSDPVDKPVYHAVTFTVEGEAVATIFAADGTEISSLPEAPEIDGEEFVGWYDGDQPFTTETEIHEDKSVLGVYREKEDIEGALYANEDLYITGKVPGNGFIDVIPVQVEVDGEETLAAYDISIYANKKQQEKGKTWQPADKKVQVHWRNDAFEGELNVYHLDGEQPEHVDTVEAENGWVTFEAQSFSAYAVTRTILNETVTTSDGMTYEIQVTYQNTSGIPMQGTELAVSEILPDDAAFTAYLEESARTIGIKPQNIEFARAFDISIVDEKDPALVYEPAGDVDVSIRLIGNSLDEYENVDVLHFAKPKRTLLKASASKSFTVEEMDSAVSGETVQFTTGSFSVYMVAGYVIEKEIVASDGQTYRITVEYGEDAGIPGDAELKVEEVSEEKYAAYLTEAAAALGADIHHISFSRLFDISIVKDEVEYQPNDAVRVTVELLDTENVDDVQVVHFEDEETPVQLTASTDGTTVAFETESFSVFSFLDFSLLDRIVSAVLGEKTGTLYENDDIILTGRMPSTGIVVAEPVEVSIDGREALAAYDIKIYAGPIMKLLGICWQPSGDAIHVTLKSDALNVENVDVYHMEDVAGEADLVTESIPVEEHTVTFDADKFSVYVIMATILTKTINTSDGSTYEIVVTYKETAGIPMEGTELVVSEVLPEDAGYEQYIGASALKLGAKTENVAFARAFDIKIVDANDPAVVYEPSGDVEVSIRLLGTSLTDYANVGVLHFIPGEGFSLETFDAETFSVDEMEAVVSEETVEFTTDSFSVYVVAGYKLEKIIQASDGNTYRITVTYDDDAGIPEGSSLHVEELADEAAVEYICRAAVAMNASGFDFGRVFDITIMTPDGAAIQPGNQVQVSVELLDVSANEEDYSVVHFVQEGSSDEEELPDEESISEYPVVLSAETEGNVVSFAAESFSAYAIVQGPEPVPPGWKQVTTMEEFAAKASEGLYPGHSDGHWFMDTTYTPKTGRTGIRKTKPASGAPPAQAVKYYFEQAGSDNQYYAYCLAGNGDRRYVRQNGDSLLLTDESGRTSFTVQEAGNNAFTLESGGYYWNQQGNAAGNGFAAWNENNAGSKIIFKYYEEPVEDPYGLDGLAYGLLNWNNEVTGRAMMAESIPEVQNALAAKLLTVMTQKDNNADKLFVPNSSDITMWTFHWVEMDTYYLTAVVDGATKYLQITDQGLSMVDTQDSSCKIQVVPGAGNYAGRICLKGNNKTLVYSGDAGTGFGVNGSTGSEWLYLVEESELTDDYFRIYSANKVGVSDPGVTNGVKIILYTRVWNDTDKRYEFYAVDSDGKLKRCFESGDHIQWVGGQLNTLLWNFVEYHWEDTGDPNFYYELYNQYSEKFIAPQVTGGQILSSDPIGINMNGRRDGYFQSDILAWDDANYTFVGLKADIENMTVVPCSKEEAEDFYFAIVTDLPVDDSLTEVATVDHVQNGITMRITDFDADSNAIDKNPMSNFLGSDFGTAGSPPTQGLLSTNLGSDGYPTSTSGGESLSNLLSGGHGPRPVNHLFISSTYYGTGYYEFDSAQNFASLQSDNNFRVYKQIASYDSQGQSNTRKHGQFVPFNSIKPGVFASVNGKNLYDVYGKLLPNSDPRKYENLYTVEHDGEVANLRFAVELKASFTQTPNGHDAWGHDIIYEFTGDDDFWLYVDGELIIDLGGIHSALEGRVNFSTGEVYVNKKWTTIHDLFVENRSARGESPDVRDIFEPKLDGNGNQVKDTHGHDMYTFKDYTTHTMRIFYMERGAGASNLHMRFNLASVRPGTVELSKKVEGIDNNVPVLAEFPYQIYYTMPGDEGENPTEHLLRPVDENHDGRDDNGISVRYKDSSKTVTYHESLQVPGINEPYEHVYMLKPGETAVISFPDDAIDYRIVECGVNTGIYSTSVNEVSDLIETSCAGSDKHKNYGIGHAEAKNRPRISYVNTVKPEALRTLFITKRLYKEDGESLLEYNNGDPTFNLRLYLGTEFAAQTESANMYAYHVIDPSGRYCVWDAANQRFKPLSGDDSYVKDYSRFSDEEKKATTFHTSIYGQITRVQAGYTVVVPNILAGTQFRVQERPSEIPDGFSFQQYIYNTITYSDDTETETEKSTGKNAVIGVTDTAVANEDPHVIVCNIRGWGLRVNKIWSDADYMVDRDDTYFAVYIQDSEGNLTLPSDATVQDENGEDTTVVRRMKLKKGDKLLPQSLYWYFPQLLSGTSALHDYVIREVTLTGNYTVDDAGCVTLNGATVTPIEAGGTLSLTGTQKGESGSAGFDYTVVYQPGTVQPDSQVRVDTVGNNRAGLVIQKTQWDGTTPLAGAQFVLKDKNDAEIGTFTSDAAGMVTIAYLSNDGSAYTLTEIAGPQGWHGLESPLTISQQNGTVTVTGETSAFDLQQGAGVTTTLTVKNRPYTFTVVKQSSDGLGNFAPLAGAVFELHKQKTVGGQTAFDVNPEVGYEELSSDTEGIVPKLDNTLPSGTYQLREKQPPEGYQELGGYIHFTISPTGSITLGACPAGVTLTSVENEETGALDYTLTVNNEQFSIVAPTGYRATVLPFVLLFAVGIILGCAGICRSRQRRKRYGSSD